MAYNSAHTGPQIDAAVEMLGQIQSARDATAADRDEVAFLASQVDDNADQVATQAATVSTQTAQVLASAAEVDQAHDETLSASALAVDAKDAAALSAVSAQQSKDSATASASAAAQSQVEAGLSEQISAENAESSSADRLVVEALAQQVEANSESAQINADSAALSALNAAAVVTGGTATIAPSPGKIPLADAQGKVDSGWIGEDIARTDAVQAATDLAIDGLEAIADIQNPADPAKGAVKVGWDGEQLDKLLENAKSLADYAALRTYTGLANTIAIRSMGASGAVVRDASVSGDDNLTKFVDGAGRQWRRLQLTLTLEQCGISSSNTPAANATLLTAAILGGVRIAGGRSAYSFDFAGAAITYSGSVLQMDLGPYLHTFTNWGGIVANNIAVLEYSGRIDAGGSYCKGLGRFRNLMRAKIGTLEFQNVFCVNPVATAQFFGIEYSSDTYGDNPLVIDIDSIYIQNVRTQTYSQGSGLAIPMTILGNYGSGSSQVKRHQLNIGNFHVEEYYSVNQDGVTPIDGDSDVMRLFTNPTQVSIGSIYAKNIAKRFFKTQETALISCPNVYWSNDSRFPASVFIGFFEGQVANSGNPTHFEIGVCEAYYPSEDTGLPLLFNASGLAHSINIATLRYKNVGFYSQDQNVGISIGAAAGSCLSILASQSSNLAIRRLTDTGIRSIVALVAVIENFAITFGASISITGFILVGVHLKRGSLLGWKTTTRVAQFYTMEDVILTYTSGASYIRAFQPITGGMRRVTALTVNDPTGLVNQVIEGPSGGIGTLAIRNFRGVGAIIATGVFTTGTWEVRLDDCSPSTFTGAGATVKTVSYV